MKKVQVSTVRQTADVEVIFINASFISKVINAANAIEGFINQEESCNNIKRLCKPETDENGEQIVDEEGFVKTVPVLDKNGKQVVEYSNAYIDQITMRKLDERVKPFLVELRKALEE